MNESLDKIIEAFKGAQKARALNSFLIFAGGGVVSVAAFMLGRLSGG